MRGRRCDWFYPFTAHRPTLATSKVFLRSRFTGRKASGALPSFHFCVAAVHEVISQHVVASPGEDPSPSGALIRQSCMIDNYLPGLEPGIAWICISCFWLAPFTTVYGTKTSYGNQCQNRPKLLKEALGDYVIQVSPDREQNSSSLL